MEKIKNKLIMFLKNDLVERCYKTFFQAFIGVLVSAEATDFLQLDTAKTLFISAAIAGVCAIWNVIKTVIDNKLKK